MQYPNPITKHSYPVHIKLFSIGLGLAFLYVTSFFLFLEIKDHCQLKSRINEAERYFVNKDYSVALCMYKSLMLQYYFFSQARTRVVQCCFALAENNPEFYDDGLSFLMEKISFRTEEIEEFARYLPSEQKKNEFRSIFVRA